MVIKIISIFQIIPLEKIIHQFTLHRDYLQGLKFPLSERKLEKETQNVELHESDLENEELKDVQSLFNTNLEKEKKICTEKNRRRNKELCEKIADEKFLNEYENDFQAFMEGVEGLSISFAVPNSDEFECTESNEIEPYIWGNTKSAIVSIHD